MWCLSTTKTSLDRDFLQSSLQRSDPAPHPDSKCQCFAFTDSYQSIALSRILCKQSPRCSTRRPHLRQRWQNSPLNTKLQCRCFPGQGVVSDFECSEYVRVLLNTLSMRMTILLEIHTCQVPVQMYLRYRFRSLEAESCTGMHALYRYFFLSPNHPCSQNPCVSILVCVHVCCIL